MPFLNARPQDLYKLGYAEFDNPRRFALMAGGVSLASLGLMVVYSDDDDWEKREHWDRDSYWWFKIDGMVGNCRGHRAGSDGHPPPGGRWEAAVRVDQKAPHPSCKELSEGGLVADVPKSKWKAFYAAPNDDLGEAAEKARPEALQGWKRANQYTKGSIQRLDQLESIVSRDAREGLQGRH